MLSGSSLPERVAHTLTTGVLAAFHFCPRCTAQENDIPKEARSKLFYSVADCSLQPGGWMGCMMQCQFLSAGRLSGTTWMARNNSCKVPYILRSRGTCKISKVSNILSQFVHSNLIITCGRTWRPRTDPISQLREAFQGKPNGNTALGNQHGLWL